MIHPSVLVAGDSIGIVAPGRKIEESVVREAGEILSGWGLRVRHGSNLFSNAHSYLGGTDEERREDFQNMLDDRLIKGILCARGGYGSTRIIDKLDFTALIENPKWIIGFSDITAIHLKCATMGVSSIHGLMPVLFKKKGFESSLESLRQVLFGKTWQLRANHHPFNRPGKISAEMTGGNLSLIVDSLGTSTEIETAGKILVLEEIDEYRYRLDRMMTQLKRAGKLKDLAGLVLGHFTSIKDTETTFGESVEDILNNAVAGYTYPVGFGFPTGHEHPNHAWIRGGVGMFEVTSDGASLTSVTADIG